MTIMTSGRKANHDPAPYRIDGVRADRSALDRVWSGGAGAFFDPRPKFDVPVNGVLALFRKQRSLVVPQDLHVAGFLNGITRLASDGFSIAEIAHARSVLSKLAAVSS